MTMAIFHHRDCDGDAVEILADPQDPQEDIVFLAGSHRGHSVRVRLDEDAQERLINALQQQQQQRRAEFEPQYSGSVAETLVRRLVAEEVARVLPLHQSPQAVVPAEHRPQECPGWPKCPEGPDHEYASNTSLRLCTIPECNTPGAAYHLEHDPEPKAVGHPEAPGIDWTDKSGVRYEYCTECGHSWTRHGVGAGNCNVRVAPGDGNRHRECGCEAIQADQVQMPIPAGCECGHSWVDHGRFGIRGCGVLPCGCSRAVPRAECTCPVGPRIRSYPHSHQAGCPHSTSGAS